MCNGCKTYRRFSIDPNADGCCRVTCSNCTDDSILCLHESCGHVLHVRSNKDITKYRRDPIKWFIANHTERAHSRESKCESHNLDSKREAKRIKLREVAEDVGIGHDCDKWSGVKEAEERKDVSIAAEDTTGEVKVVNSDDTWSEVKVRKDDNSSGEKTSDKIDTSHATRSTEAEERKDVSSVAEDTPCEFEFGDSNDTGSRIAEDVSIAAEDTAGEVKVVNSDDSWSGVKVGKDDNSLGEKTSDKSDMESSVDSNHLEDDNDTISNDVDMGKDTVFIGGESDSTTFSDNDTTSLSDCDSVPNMIGDSHLCSPWSVDAPIFEEDESANTSLMNNTALMDVVMYCHNQEDDLLSNQNNEEADFGSLKPFSNEKDDIDRLYEDFLSIYDFRTDEEMIDRRSQRIRICQTALYLAQKSIALSRDPTDHMGGYRGLVFRSMIKNMEMKYHMANDEEAEAMFFYHMLILDLTDRSRESLIAYEQKKAMMFGHSQMAASSYSPICVKFPQSLAELRSHITTGELSIMRNFPVNRVFNIGNHACVSLRETIGMMAAHHGGFSFAWDGITKTRNREGLNGSKAVKKLVKKIRRQLTEEGYSKEKVAEISIGYFYTWSDSFLRCFVKQKDNSVWIMTITFCPPYSDMSTGRYTYVVAMGKSSEDHTKVLEYFHHEIQDLLKGFKIFDASTNSVRFIVPSLLFISADRPERAAIACTRQEGNWGKVTGYAVKINPKLFAACRGCYSAIAKEAVRTNDADGPEFHTGCKRCLCWTMSTSDDPKMYSRVPTGYPTKQIPDRKFPKGRKPGSIFVGPVKMSSAWAIAACKYAYDARRLGHWSMENVRQYLKTCNIRQECIEALLQMADIDKKTQTIRDHGEYVPKIWLYYANLWANYMLADLPMHAIAHGIIPDCITAIHQIFANWKRFTSFVNYVNPIIEILQSYGLSWCKIKTLPKTAWVSENTMAYMRIFSYLYGMYFLNGRFNKEVSTTVLHIKRLNNSLQSVVSLLMSRSKPDHKRISILFKLLMSSANELQTEYGSFHRDSDDTTKRKGSEYKGVLQSISGPDMHSLTTEMSIHVRDSDSLNSMRNKLGKVTKPMLMNKLVELGDTDNNLENMDKASLQKRLFELILDKKINTESSDKLPNQELPERTAKESEFWNKGAWLSLSQNYSGMIDFFSQMLLLWFVV